MKSSRLLAMSAMIAGCVWVSGGGCSASSNHDGSNSPPGSSGSGGAGSIGGGGGQVMMSGGSSGSGNAGGGSLNPLCGIAPPESESCSPDDARACRKYVPPVAAGGMSGGDGESGGNSGQAGEKTDLGGQAGAGGGMNEAGGGETSGGASSGGAASGGAAGQSSPSIPGRAIYSCQVTREGNQLTRACSLAGSGTANAPCFSGADCAPSFACVTSGDSGQCLPYCCDRNTACEPGSYCTEQPLLSASSDGTAAGAPRVPVCVPADGCSLEEPFPCPAGKSCRCGAGTACMVVRDDGTTACVKPGSGQAGDPCPCAWDHVCSSVTNQCVKICRTDSSAADCGVQKCQASAELPPNFGVCVGPLP